MEWWVYAIIAVVAFIIFMIIATAINRAFLRKYGISIFVGGFFALLAAGGIVGGVFIVKSGSGIGWALLGVGAVILLILLIVDFKKCGFAVGIFAFLLQAVFCAPSILLLVDLLFNGGRSTFRSRLKSERARNEYITRNR